MSIILDCSCRDAIHTCREAEEGETHRNHFTFQHVRYFQAYWHDDDRIKWDSFTNIMDNERGNRFFLWLVWVFKRWVMFNIRIGLIVHLHRRDTDRVQLCCPSQDILYIKNRQEDKSTEDTWCHGKKGVMAFRSWTLGEYWLWLVRDSFGLMELLTRWWLHLDGR